MQRRFGFIGSILLHGSIVLYLLWPRAQQVPPPKPLPQASEETTTVKLMSVADSDKAIALGNQAGGIDPEICADRDQRYIGIGITFGFGTNLVLTAPPQYPAYRAGIRVGDMLEDPWAITNTPAWITVKVTRHDKKLSFRVKPSDICFRSGK
jgi:hypothetical protein